MNETENITTTVAEIENVAIAVHLLNRAVNRPLHLPGIVAFTGYSGLGKTFAASFAANSYNAGYVQCQYTMTRKSFLTAIAKECGINVKGLNANQILENICSELIDTGSPLIIDEADYLIEKNLIEMVRDIYEGTGAAILLIGEELFPRKLQRFERFHNRILDWGLAQKCSLDDTKKLAKMYYPNISFDEDLLDNLVKAGGGITRRIVVNLDHIYQDCLVKGITTATATSWGNKRFWTGDAPKRR